MKMFSESQNQKTRDELLQELTESFESDLYSKSKLLKHYKLAEKFLKHPDVPNTVVELFGKIFVDSFFRKMLTVGEYGFVNVNQEYLSKSLQTARDSLPLLKSCLQKHDDFVTECRNVAKSLGASPISLSNTHEKSDKEFSSLSYEFKVNF